MGDKVDMSEVFRLSDDLKVASSEIDSILERVKKDIEQIIAIESFSGKAAKQAKHYFGDFHLTIIDVYQRLFLDVKNYLGNHIDLFVSEVDSNKSTKIEKNHLQDINMDVNEQYEKINFEHQSINRTISNVGDISSTTTPDFSFVENDQRRLKKEIKNLEEKFALFTTEGKQHDLQMKELLHHIDVTINNFDKKKDQGHFEGHTFSIAYVGLPVLKDYVNNSSEEKKKLENLDRGSKVIINKAKEDYEQGIISMETYDSILQGVISTGTAFLRNAATSKLTEEISKPIAESINKWVKDNTSIFIDRGLVTVGPYGTQALQYEPPSIAKQMLRSAASIRVPIIGSVVDFGIQLYKGEEITDAALKSTGHLGAGLIGAQIGTLIGGGIGAPVGFMVGVSGSMLFDLYYDNKEKIASTFQDVGDSVVVASEKIGDAVAGFFGNLGSIFN